MPHIFKIEPYRKRIEQGKACVGDVVYLTATPNLPMTICTKPHFNSATREAGRIKARYLKPDGDFGIEEFGADELSS